jgi:signal transduction histidine kinase
MGKHARTIRLPALVLTCALMAVTPSACDGEKPTPDDGFNHRLALRFSDRLADVERRLEEISAEMKELPMLPDNDALGSHGFHSNFTSDSESNWFQIAWDEPVEIDALALIPTRMTTQSGEMSNYGFPNRLRIEAVLPDNPDPVVLASMENTHLEFRRGEPAFLSFPATKVLSLRVIPIDLPTLPGKTVRFFSLSEFLVFQGRRNIAPRGRLSAAFSIDAEAGWNIRYLTDGQSPLGPPEVPPLPRALGWHAAMAETRDSTVWAVIDLEETLPVNGVRLVAARGDAPVKGPGFGFPVRFRIQTSTAAEGDDWLTVWSTGEEAFPNPGYNMVSLRFPKTEARRVRLMVDEQHQPDLLTAPRILLSEFEVHDGTKNLALGKPVITPDVQPERAHDGKRVWSVASLTDGNSSTGRLIPLRRWVEQLSLRFDLALEQGRLRAERERILARTRALTYSITLGTLGSAIIALVIWQLRLRMSARRHIRELRRKISSDLHDEVGSNLATISLLADISPIGGNAPPLADISRLARESSLSLREIIELTLVPKRARKPLPDRLREIAGLMLVDHEWKLDGEFSPDLDPQQRRNLIFFFKEALHNIFRHAQARNVEVRLAGDERQFVLTISDDGCGLPESSSPEAPRLRTLEQRADSLHGKLDIQSGPGAGTALTLRFPLRTA